MTSPWKNAQKCVLRTRTLVESILILRMSHYIITTATATAQLEESNDRIDRGGSNLFLNEGSMKNVYLCVLSSRTKT